MHDGTSFIAKHQSTLWERAIGASKPSRMWVCVAADAVM